MKIKRVLIGALASIGLVAMMPMTALAAPTIVAVTPAHTQGWTSAEPVATTTAGGVVSFIDDSTSPLPQSALHLTTTNSSASKAQYMKPDGVTKLSNVTNLSYSTKQNSASFEAGLPSYQLPVCLNGLVENCGFTTLVYEPYVSEGNSAVQNGVWQTWNVDAGKFWSTKTVGSLVKSQGSSTYTLAQVKAEFPRTVVLSYGVDVGSGNPSYDTEVDQFTFQNTTYNFENDRDGVPEQAADCTQGQWATYTEPSFVNQRACTAYTRINGWHIVGRINYNAFGLDRTAWMYMNSGTEGGALHYKDVNNNSYTVSIKTIRVSEDGHSAYFAGQVKDASSPEWNSNWLMGKITVGTDTPKIDSISGDFMTEADARIAVLSMSNPPSGPFTAVHKYATSTLKIQK